MDILRFINSKDIRKHLKDIDYKFNSLEAAWLIYQCHDATIDEKHKAWNELIETMPDCKIEERYFTDPQESLHDYLKKYIEVENKLIKEFYDEKHTDTFDFDKPFVYKFEYIYVPAEFKTQRKMLNRGLVEAVFADKVLLVEGPSENVLFGKILSELNPFFEADGIYILPVGGFGFRPYFEILDALEIDNIIKTDNDLRKIKGKEKYSVLGFSKLNNYIGEDLLPTEPIDESGVEAKRKLYDSNRETLDQIRKEHALYLSRCSLEEDLDEVLHDKMVEYLTQADGDVIG